MDGRVVSIITESFWPILKAGFQYTIPLTLISFALGTFIAVIVAVIRISKVKGLDLICPFLCMGNKRNTFACTVVCCFLWTT